MDYLIVTALVLLSGAFSGLTLGFFSLNLTSLERKIKLGDRQAAKVYPVRKRGNLLLCTLLLGNVAVNSTMAIFLGNIATGVVAGIISTALIVVFGEIIPQAVFSRFALLLGSKTVWLVKIFIFLLFPIAYPLSWLLDKALGEELGTIWSKREIEEIIRHHEDAEESEIDEDEERILLGALAFSDKLVESITTPKPMVFLLEENQVIDEGLIELIKEKGHSRIPIVSEEKEDDILGILFARDLLGMDLKAGKTVKDYLRREVLFIKDSMTLDDLLNHFLAQKRHMACVFDEFGVFLGVVTLEDILEEILKREIIDEADKEEDPREEAAKLLNKNLLE